MKKAAPTTTSVDQLEVLILSHDSRLVGVIRAALREVGLASNCLPMDPRCASEVLVAHHFDGVILDCGDVDSAKQILKRIQEGPSNRQSPVIAVVDGPTEMRAFQNAGANFCLSRPISLRDMQAELNSAIDSIRREHHRYFRYRVSLPIVLGTEEEGFVSARLTNVSAEGMGMLVRTSIKPKGTVSVRFDLPSINPYQIEATGEVIWVDARNRVGIKLSHMGSEARRKYGEWLDVLHGQFEFRRQTEPAQASGS